MGMHLLLQSNLTLYAWNISKICGNYSYRSKAHSGYKLFQWILYLGKIFEDAWGQKTLSM